MEHYEQFSDDPMDRSDSYSGSGEKEGQLSDSNDAPEQTEDVIQGDGVICSIFHGMASHPYF